MNKILFSISALAFIALIACNNSADDKSNVQARVDSLEKEVIEVHNVAMAAQMTKMEKAKKDLQVLLDSLNKLPAKAKEAAASQANKLDSLKKELDYADMAMDKWMEEFKLDSAFSDVQEKINYLANEKLKVDKVKEAMLNSLQKADSVLHKKF